MKLDSCGLPEDQFIEIFQKKAQFLGKLLTTFHPGTQTIMDEKIAWEMFQECVYAAEAEARDIVDPEGKDDPFGPKMFISREDMMFEIKSVNAKVESLTDYISILLKAEK
jgi:hypothetical protein